MKNITKLGLTALAGSLVASSAYAGALSVSGSAKITHASADETEVQGNSFSNSKGITFSGSGDLDNGYTVSTTYTMTNAAFSTSTVTIDMGDMGTVGLWNNSGGAGLTKYYDVVPTAGEQVWDDSDTDDNGLAIHDNDNMLGYNGTFGNVDVSLAYVNGGAAGANGGASDSSWVVQYNGLMDGLTLGLGMGENGSTQDLTTMYAKYTAGSVTVGYQMSHDDFNATSGATTAFYENTAYGISFQVNDDFTISYANHDSERGLVHNGTTAPVELEAESLQLSYTMGGMSVKFAESSVDNASYTAGSAADWDGRTVALTLAF